MKTAMTIETSDVPGKRSLLDYAALSIATGGGVGYAPLVPATFGSLLGVGIYLATRSAGENFVVWTPAANSAAATGAARGALVLIFLIALFLIGIWAATRVVVLTGEKDPRVVVVDEVVGQLITFLFVPADLGWWTIALGFFVFRFFDIWKPYPTDKLEDLPTGLGVMADDAMAGFYSAALVSAACWLHLTI